MKQRYKIALIVAVLFLFFILIFFVIHQNNNAVYEAKEEAKTSQSMIQSSQLPVKYFDTSDKIVISADKKVLYMDNPTTGLSYYAFDTSGELVHFREEDKAFVRILGVTRLYTQNTEIPHAARPDETIDDAVFYGNITIPKPGKYLIKVCMGKSINLDSEGNLVWPFGCYEDSTSDVIDVYE